LAGSAKRENGITSRASNPPVVVPGGATVSAVLTRLLWLVALVLAIGLLLGAASRHLT